MKWVQVFDPLEGPAWCYKHHMQCKKQRDGQRRLKTHYRHRVSWRVNQLCKPGKKGPVWECMSQDVYREYLRLIDIDSYYRECRQKKQEELEEKKIWVAQYQARMQEKNKKGVEDLKDAACLPACLSEVHSMCLCLCLSSCMYDVLLHFV